MATRVRVIAPYVTLKVKDSAGGDIVTGFYQGAVVENVDAESLKHHLDHGMVEKVSVTETRPEAKASEKKS